MNTAMNWIERLRGVPTATGEGAAWSIDYAWPWPPWATLLFCALAVGFVTMAYLRQRRRTARSYRLMLAVVRLTIIAVVLAMIAQVTLSRRVTGLPGVAILLDDSLSMTIADQYPERTQQSLVSRMKQAGLDGEPASRWNLAKTLLTEDDGALLNSIAKDHKPRVYFLTDVRPCAGQDIPAMVEEIRAATPQGEITRLGGAVRTVLNELRGTKPAALLALTDGINTEWPRLADAAEFARRRGVPLFFIGLGSHKPVRDLKLSDLLVDDVVFVDDAVTFECRLTSTGYQGRKAIVTLREKGKPTELAKVETILGPDGRPQPVRLSHRPSQVGQFEYVIEVEPQKGERQTENNRLSRLIQVRKEKIRVLLVQAYPNYEFRYLRNMLERDETIALSTVLQDADLGHAEQEPSALRTFPSREELFAYDVVILGDANPSLLGNAALKNLADFVDQPAKGGALILIAGPSYMPAAYRETPLVRLFPFSSRERHYPKTADAVTTPFVVQPTDLGLADPAMQLGATMKENEAIWHSLAPLNWLLPLGKLKPGVRVLAEGPMPPDDQTEHRLPVFCLQYIGAGKVLFHATDETWRWRYRVGDVYFARYWIQTIRSLCRSKLADGRRSAVLTTDRRDYVQGDAARVRVRFADERLAPTEDDGVTLAVEPEGGQIDHVQLRRTTAGRGVFEGLIKRLAPGEYHVWIAEPTVEGQTPAVDFAVAPPAGEFARIQMDAAEMRRAAELTGGRFYTFDTARKILRALPPGRQVPIESLPPVPLWNRWPALALLLGLLITEWMLRKIGGMV